MSANFFLSRNLKRRKLAELQLRRKSSSSFDIDIVTTDYERRTSFAAANYRKKGNILRMVIPPPNVTGKLHLGHALTVSIEDAICRHHRVQGGIAEWIPGFDHAGIATQAVVEQKLFRETGKTRKDVSREEFVDICQKWSEKCSTEIKGQLIRLGASLDWDQCYYTLDNKFSSAVTHAFCKLHQDGLIFRGERMVNWCPTLASTLSDQEIECIDVSASGTLRIPSFKGEEMRNVKVGTMQIVRYKLCDAESYLDVGTTRPETLFADIALAVNPKDERYSKFIGKSVRSPVADRLLPIVADEKVVPGKGTGVLKITPFHDALDFEIFKRHSKDIERAAGGLPDPSELVCIDAEGRMINTGDVEIDGIDRFEARKKVLEILSRKSCYGGKIPHEDAKVNVCTRTGDVIEPRLMNQWFLDVSEMHQRASAAIKSQKIKVYPDSQTHRLLHWFQNTEPWCLSRQLLWGHRIPAYRCSSSEDWIVAESREKASSLLSRAGADILQDTDVLDTWFSSSLVPLVTKERSAESRHRPAVDVMETGWDISGFWVARMIAMHLRLTDGEVPFTQVILHGLVRDGEGRKMSKSLGNVIDPLDVIDGIDKEKMFQRLKQSSLAPREIDKACTVIEKRFPDGIPRCGPDALRYALLKYDVLASDVPVDVVSMATEGLRFCNKLWNMAAYYDQLADKCRTRKDVTSSNPLDEWLISRLASTLLSVDQYMKSYALHLALTSLHSFITSDVCDVYLETSKKSLWEGDLKRIETVRSTLQRVLQPTFVQLSVFMPFVCEHLYERIFAREQGSILFDVVKPSFFAFHQNEELERIVDLLLSTVKATRYLRTRLQISSKLVFEGVLTIGDSAFRGSEEEISCLAGSVTPIGNLALKEVRCGVPEGVSGHMAVPIPGYDAQIWLLIEKSSHSEFLSCLNLQLEKTKARQNAFLEKALSYDKLVEKNSSEKPAIIEKLRRKAVQARQVAESASEEADRIRKVISAQRNPL